MLPILHLNGYKIANPCFLARIPEDELRKLLEGMGYARTSSTGTTRCRFTGRWPACSTRAWRKSGASRPTRGANGVLKRAGVADDRLPHAEGVDVPGR